METVEMKTLAGVIDKKMNRQLKQYIDICARCAICKDACHQYVGTGDFKYLPARPRGAHPPDLQEVLR